MFIWIIGLLTCAAFGRERDPLDIATPDRAPEEPPEADLFAVWAYKCCILDAFGCWIAVGMAATGPVGVCTLVLAAFSFTCYPSIWV